MERRNFIVTAALALSCAPAASSETEQVSQNSAQAITTADTNAQKKAAILNWRDATGKAVRVVSTNPMSNFSMYWIADDAGAVWQFDLVASAVSAAYPLLQRFYPTTDCSGPWYVQGPITPRLTVPTAKLDNSGLEIRVVPDVPTRVQLNVASIGDGSQCSPTSFTSDTILLSTQPVVAIPQPQVLVPAPFHPEFISY